MIPPPRNLAAYRAGWRATNDLPVRTTPCFRVSNVDSARPKLYVYDMIGGWDLDASEFVQAVHALDATDLDLHINSPGGFVYDAVAMYEALQSSATTVHAHIDGLAGSAASFLAMAGDSVDIAKGGRIVIHDAQMLALGSPADLREAADLGDAVSDDIAGYYADRAGGTVASWRAAMTATTTYSAQQAVDVKLADRVTGDVSRETDSGPDNRSRIIRARAAITLRG